MTITAARLKLANPFPGLRPFYPGEEHLFFGRESQVDAMVDKLARSRFLAVIGTSGSGKSSLVNCGLRPALHRGLMASAGTSWRIAQFRPGGNPIQSLARALAANGVLFSHYDSSGLSLEDIVGATLRMSKLGIADLYEQTLGENGPNLLIVADQFEELFRFRQMKSSAVKAERETAEDAVAFVNLLLEAQAQTVHPIYVVITMRSDFLGDCAEFAGLPEAINEGQYLVPRLTRDERRMAVVGPVGVGDGEIDPVLVTQLVNDVGDNPDQLSLLQHALNRTWMRWQHEGGGAGVIAPAQYLAIGTMAHALDQHADKAFSELGSDREKSICETIFKALTDTAMDGRGVRRPTPVKTLCALTGASLEEITRVIDVFRKPSRSFLMPPLGEPLLPDTVIDISHESLMRVWERLKSWTEQESQSARLYRRLSETAALHAVNRAGLARDPELQLALNWRTEAKPTAAWAERYCSGFEEVMRFLDESESERAREWIEAEQRQKREMRRARMLVGAIVFAVVLGLVTVIIFTRDAALRDQERARQAQQLADAKAHAITELLRTQAQEREAQARLSTLQRAWKDTTDVSKKAVINSQLQMAQARVYEASAAATKVWAAASGGKVLPADALDHAGLFTVGRGLKVTGTSGASHEYNMFGGTDRAKGDLDVATFFADQKPADFLHWIQWQTAGPVRLQSVQLFAFHDSADIGYKFRRAFSKFRLLANIDGAWKPLVDFTPSLPYGQTLGTHAGDSLALCFDVPFTIAKSFRAEFVQAVDILGNWSGPRVVKLDGSATACQ